MQLWSPLHLYSEEKAAQPRRQHQQRLEPLIQAALPSFAFLGPTAAAKSVSCQSRTIALTDYSMQKPTEQSQSRHAANETLSTWQVLLYGYGIAAKLLCWKGGVGGCAW